MTVTPAAALQNPSQPGNEVPEGDHRLEAGKIGVSIRIFKPADSYPCFSRKPTALRCRPDSSIISF
jgi:hypothetical protein